MVTKYVQKCVQIVAAKRSEMEITSAVVVDSGIRHLKILDDFMGVSGDVLWLLRLPCWRNSLLPGAVQGRK